MNQTKQQEIVFVTGPAGAGRNTAIKALEDIGFESIDNLPLTLLARLLSGPPIDRPLAIGIDTRTRDFSVSGLLDAISTIQNDDGFSVSLLFLDCSAATLDKRFSETRRRHPLSRDGTAAMGIEQEIKILTDLRARADVLIDTTNLSPHELRDEIARWFNTERASTLAVSVQSFSYKRGTPQNVDMVLDCRFLQNPHWQPDLRGLTGLNEEVAAYVKQDHNFDAFFAKLSDMLTLLLPAYQTEGKSYFSVALGCTGGQHRSVTVAECLAKKLADSGWQVSIRHRELDR